jgi:RNA polymerase sigma-70 factor (ECF subfamily)
MSEVGRRREDRQTVGAVRSFDSFYRSEVQSVLAVTMALTRHRWEAEEATQEAFLRAYRDWERVGAMASPEGWVRTVALNLARGRWRRMRSEARALLRLTPRPEGPPPDPETERFWDAVRALPTRQAQVVALTYVEDLDSEAIGRILGIAASTVRVHLARAREALAAALEVER